MNKLLEKPRVEITGLLSVFILAIATRLPYVWQGLPPYLSCDEGFFANDVFRMLFEPTPLMHEFRSGSMNSWPVLLPAAVLKLLGLLSYSNLIVLGRLLLPVLLGSLTVFPLYLLMRKLVISRASSLLTILLFAISPTVVSMAEMWYPDSYIFFVSSLLIYRILSTMERQKPLPSDFGLIAIFAIGVSIKHNFAFFIVLLVLFSHSQLFNSNVFSKQTIREFLTTVLSYQKFFIYSVMCFFLINFSIFFDFINFLRAINSNRKIYAVQDINFIPGTIFYVYNLFVTPLGLVGLLILLVGVRYGWKIHRNFILQSLIFLAAFLIVAGFPKQVLSRNTNLLLPFIFIYFAFGLEFLRKLNGKAVAFVSLSALSLSISFSSFEFLSEQLKTDSYRLMEIYSRSNLVGESVGVSNACNGPSPAFIGGAKVSNDQTMSENLMYYVYSSYSLSPLKDYFYQKNIFVNSDARNRLMYNFNDSRIASGWKSKIILEELVPAEKYKILRVIDGAGPTFVVLKRID